MRCRRWARNATFAYNARGNTTVLADQTLLYDINDNRITTTLTNTAPSCGTVIDYLRGVAGTIVQRSHTPPGGGTAEVWAAA